MKIRGRRKEKEKLPSGITADYSAEFFAALNADSVSSELDRGNEEIVASVHTTIESRYNGNGTPTSKHSISESITFSSSGGDLAKVSTASTFYFAQKFNVLIYCYRAVLCFQSHLNPRNVVFSRVPVVI